MAKKQNVDKALSKAADLILDMLAELPRENAQAARAEISELAAKSSRRSVARGRAAKPRRSGGSRPSRRSAAKSA